MSSQKLLTLKIRLFDGNSIELNIKSSLQVVKIKGLVSQRCQYPVEEQRLFYMGQELQNSKRLSHYQIPNNSIIQLFPKSRLSSTQTPESNVNSSDIQEPPEPLEPTLEIETIDIEMNYLDLLQTPDDIVLIDTSELAPVAQQSPVGNRTSINLERPIFYQILHDIIQIDSASPALTVEIELPTNLTRETCERLLQAVSSVILQSANTPGGFNRLCYGDSSQVRRKVLAFLQLKGRASLNDELTIVVGTPPAFNLAELTTLESLPEPVLPSLEHLGLQNNIADPITVAHYPRGFRPAFRRLRRFFARICDRFIKL